MEKEKLKELIIEHKEKFLKKTELVKREIQKDIAPLLNQREIIIITGVRRGGKSSLMRLISNDLIEKYDILQDNILYLNFEDERFTYFDINDFEQVYEIFLELYHPVGRKYFFLDEIQNVKGWEKWLNRLYEFEDLKIFVTGSNATLLSPEIATALTGRNRQLIVYPFSFNEFLSLRNYSITEKDFYLREKRLEIKRLFDEYLKLGGFPEVLKISDNTLLEQYLKDIIYRDVIARYSIRNIKEIKELTLFLASNIGTIQSYNNLREMINVKSLNTIKNYLEMLENVFLFFKIDLFSFSVKKQIYNPSKIYSVDSALSNVIAFKFSENIGHIYENIVFIELQRRNKEVFYWKSKRGREVDFVIKSGLKIDEAIQVCFSFTDKKTRDRELESLLSAKNELNVDNLVMITEDEKGEEVIDGATVRIIPLWKWLLQSE
ncbi:MAG TPA: ATP-binding protein [Candidatus Marinimicrobia bacterium]|nr:ATP-binding protein [Candidatus Neomarinimicrobiota bacterium]